MCSASKRSKKGTGPVRRAALLGDFVTKNKSKVTVSNSFDALTESACFSFSSSLKRDNDQALPSPNLSTPTARCAAGGRRRNGGAGARRSGPNPKHPDGRGTPSHHDRQSFAVPTAVKKQPDATDAGLDPVSLAGRQLKSGGLHALEYCSSSHCYC